MVREGRALLLIPDPETARAPHGFEPAWMPVFYNPRMVFNRDVSVLAVRIYVERYAPHKPVHAVDALSGTGVRAVRYAVESTSEILVHANDIDPRACQLIRENIALNRLADRVTPHCTDANALLETIRREEPILLADIDPFGSPAPFAHAAIRAVGHGGLAAFTATDLAVLEGSKRRAATRKYWVSIAKTPESKEIGLRVLLGYIARAAASSDKAVRPVLSYYADHYYRVYMLVSRGARKADNMLERHVGNAVYCQQARKTVLGDECPSDEKGTIIGPVWTGPLSDGEFISALLNALEGYEYLETRERTRKLLQLLYEEASVCDSCIFYRLDALASVHTPRIPKISAVIDNLRGMGYRASRTHFHPMGLRTNAPYEAVVSVLRAHL